MVFLICHLWIFYSVASVLCLRMVGKALPGEGLWLAAGSYFETAAAEESEELQASLRCRPHAREGRKCGSSG